MIQALVSLLSGIYPLEGIVKKTENIREGKEKEKENPD